MRESGVHKKEGKEGLFIIMTRQMRKISSRFHFFPMIRFSVSITADLTQASGINPSRNVMLEEKKKN